MYEREYPNWRHEPSGYYDREHFNRREYQYVGRLFKKKVYVAEEADGEREGEGEPGVDTD